jgi:hypothetical protein
LDSSGTADPPGDEEVVAVGVDADENQQLPLVHVPEE